MYYEMMEYLTAKMASANLGLSANSMREYAVRYGVGTKLGRDWLFSLEDVEVIKSHCKKGRGRPKDR